MNSSANSRPQSLSLIVAVSQNRVIGREGNLPFRLSADLRRFKQLTMNHHIIMGRRTLESIGRLLPGRTTVVLTRRRDFRWPQAVVVHSREEALAAVASDDEPFVVGGRQVYDEFMPFVDRIYLTRVLADVDGDTHFAELDRRAWHQDDVQAHRADDRNEFDYRFETWTRQSGE